VSGRNRPRPPPIRSIQPSSNKVWAPVQDRQWLRRLCRRDDRDGSARGRKAHSSTYDSVKAVSGLDHRQARQHRGANIRCAAPGACRRSDLGRLAGQASSARFSSAVASSARDRQVHSSTPGVPADRATALRRAFDGMVKDDEFVAEARKLRLELLPLAAKSCSRLSRSVQDLSPS